MPTFEDLPIELRQEIFKLAFDHAIETDLAFNDNIERYIRSYAGSGRLEVRHPQELLRAMGPFATHEDDWHPGFFATYLCALFERLCKIFPTTVDDAKSVFSKALDAFEKKMID